MSGSDTPRRDMDKRGRVAKRGRLVVVLLLTIAFVAFLVVAVFPTRSYLDQRADTAKAAERLNDLDQRNKDLDVQIAKLQTPDEIERIARKEYGLVKPGEEVYAILPSPPPPVPLADVWPFGGVAASLNQ